MKITKFIRALLIVFSLAMVILAVSCGETPAETTVASKAETTEAKTTEAETTEAETTKAPVVTEATETDEPEDPEADSTTESQNENGESEEAECKHVKGNYAYGSDNNADTKLAVLVAKCTKCGEVMETKAATFYTAIEAIYGNDSTNANNVTLFQAGAVAPIMGSSVVTLGAGKDNCPADGVHPIAYDSSTGFAGMFGVGGWAGYIGSSAADGAAFMAVDRDGNVVLDWTPITGILESSGLFLVKDGEDAIDGILANAYSDASVNGVRFNHIVDVRGYSKLAGKTVDIIFAFTTSKGVDGDVYIPYLTIEDMQIPAAQ